MGSGGALVVGSLIPKKWCGNDERGRVDARADMTVPSECHCGRLSETAGRLCDERRSYTGNGDTQGNPRPDL